MRFKAIFISAILLEIALIVYFALPLVLRTPTAIIRINSNSMLPEFKAGDVAFISGRSGKNAYLGEVIVFYNPTEGKLTVHRAIEEGDGCYTTKGDNNDYADFFKPCGDYILGKVVNKIDL